MLDGTDDEPGFLVTSSDLDDTDPSGPYFEVILGEAVNDWTPRTVFSTTTKICEQGCCQSHWVPRFVLSSAVSLEDGLDQSSAINEIAMSVSSNFWAMVFVAGDSPLTRLKAGGEDLQ